MADFAERPDIVRGQRFVVADVWAKLRGALEQRPFLRSVTVMLSGTTAGQLVSILLAPVLTRLFSPAQFGVLSVYLAILAILVVVGSLRYEMAIPIAKTDGEAINLAAVCFCVLAVMTALVAAGSMAVPEVWLQTAWTQDLDAERLSNYRSLLSIGFFLLGAYFIVLYLATRDSAFRAIALSRLSQGVAGPLSQVGFGIAGMGAPGLIVGSIIGQSGGTLGLAWRTLRGKSAALRDVSWSEMKRLAVRFRRFPLMSSWTGLLDAAGGNHLLYLIISIQYAPQIAGFIFLLERVVARPLSMVGTSILQVFIGEAGRTSRVDPAKLKRRFYQVTLYQFCMAAAWIAIANVAATAFFGTVFGAEWNEAVYYLYAISLAYLGQATIQPVFHTLQTLERQGLAAAWQMTRLILSLSVFAGGAVFNATAWQVIAAYGAVQACCSLALFFIMARAVNALQVKPI